MEKANAERIQGMADETEEYLKWMTKLDARQKAMADQFRKAFVTRRRRT